MEGQMADLDRPGTYVIRYVCKNYLGTSAVPQTRTIIVTHGLFAPDNGDWIVKFELEINGYTASDFTQKMQDKLAITVADVLGLPLRDVAIADTNDLNTLQASMHLAKRGSQTSIEVSIYTISPTGQKDAHSTGREVATPQFLVDMRKR
jgi:hypothetical protein